MSGRADISKLKSDLLLRESLREKSAEEKAADKKTAKGLSGIPVKKMMDQSLYIDKELLPGIEKKRGTKNHPDYEFFASVRDSLLYAIILADRYDHLLMRNTQLRVFQNLQVENIALLERELAKYNALEDLFYSDALDKMADVVKTRAEELLKGKI